MPETKASGWFNDLKQNGKESFSKLLQHITGTKDLFFDPSLISPLDLFIDPGFRAANEVMT